MVEGTIVTGLGQGLSVHLLRFGPGRGLIWMDDVVCQGNEYFIQDCQHPGFGENNCIHSEDAGVVCQGKCAPSASSRTHDDIIVIVAGNDDVIMRSWPTSRATTVLYCMSINLYCV